MSRGLSIWAALCFIFLLAPIAVLVAASFSPRAFLTFPPEGFSLKWYRNFVEDPNLMGSVVTSVTIATIVSGLAVAVSCLAAVGLVKSSFPTRSVLLSSLAAPVIFPAVLVGLAFLQFFNAVGIQGSVTAFVMAHLVLTLPYATRTAVAALGRVDPNLEDAARSLGATPLHAFFGVTLPQMRPGLAVGAIFAFIVSFNDLPVAIFISGPDTTTLPIRMFSYVQYSNDPTIAAISTTLIALLIGLVILGEWRLGISKYVAQLD